MRFILPIVLTIVALSSLSAGPLNEARVTKIINIVDVVDPAKGAHPAALSEVIKDQLGLRTGSKSRSELMFSDNTLTRIGPETYFSFTAGTRDLTLQQGTLLLQVPKGIGGAKIHTAAVTASITGTTIMMEYVPKQSLKVLVLEGSLRLSHNGVFGDSLLLTPGKMVIMPPNAKHIPDPVTVDLAHVMKTSNLINMGSGKKGEKTAAPLPSVSLINKEIEHQAAEKKNDHLVDTNLVILGHGTNVFLGSDQVMSTLDDRRNTNEPLLALVTGTPTPVPTATPSPTPDPSATPTPSATATPSATPTPTASATVTPTPSSTPSPTVTPSATPDPTPLPTPDPSATPAPSPITTLDPPPPLNVPVTFDQNQTIEFLQPRVTGTVGILPGSFYTGYANDGSASWFLFGNSTTYDATHEFDSRFGVNYDQTFPAGGVAVIRFGSITFNNGPIFLFDGPTTDLALVGDAGITDAGTGGDVTVKLDGLSSLTLATNDGGISFTKGGQFQTQGNNTTFKFLQFYQRGTGDFTLGKTISIPNASLYIDTQGDLTVLSNGNITAKNADLNVDGTLILNGQAHVGTLQLTSATAIQLGNSEAQPDFLFAYAPSLTFAKKMTVAGGELSIGAGGIDATGSDLTGFDDITTTGDLKANNVTVNDKLSVGGTFYEGVSGGFTITAGDIELLGGISSIGKPGGTGGVVNLNAPSILVDNAADAINGINVNGGDNPAGNGGNGGTVNIGTNNAPIAGDVTINVPITATTGATVGATGGNGGTINVTSNGTIAVNSTLQVSDTTAGKASDKGGNITLTSKKTSAVAISVNSSAQLLSLLSNAAKGGGGTITVTAPGGSVSVNGTATADKGTVLVTNTGTNGIVNLNGATLHGDTVKAGALGTSGVLNVGGGSIDAATTLKLYAGGSSGQINFTDDVTLSGNSLKIIAADVVTIFDNKIVTVLGNSPASVYTNFPNYTGSGGNGSTTGKFSGKGATTLPFSGAPGW